MSIHHSLGTRMYITPYPYLWWDIRDVDMLGYSADQPAAQECSNVHHLHSLHSLTMRTILHRDTVNTGITYT